MTENPPASGRLLGRWGTVRFRYRLLASLTGYAVSGFTAFFLLTSYPGWAGRDVDLWLRVGADIRAGINPYVDAGVATSFVYAPPWALLWAATAWLGKPWLWLLIGVAEVASLRYVAGSWLRVGYLGLCFLTGAELVSGAFNLVIAAGLVAAMRGDSRLAAFVALAKLSPAMAIRELRGPLLVLGASLLVTLPVLGLWFDWIAALVRAPSTQSGLGFHVIPWIARFAVALAILALWRSPRAGPLAAALSIPALYSISVVLFYAVLAEPGSTGRRGTTGSVDASHRMAMLTGRWWVRERSGVD